MNAKTPHKDYSYFTHARKEILPHVPERCLRVLELGAGAGGTLGFLRQSLATQDDGLWLGAVEAFDGALDELHQHADQVWQEDVQRFEFSEELGGELLDCVLCLDILEHLQDPWDVVRRFSPLLRPGGRLIMSIPNVRHWRFVLRLLFKGDFHYTEAGILDRTHLRFFTLETAVALGEIGGLCCVWRGDIRHERFSFLRRLFSRMLLPLTAKQFLLVFECPSVLSDQGGV